MKMQIRQQNGIAKTNPVGARWLRLSVSRQTSSTSVSNVSLIPKSTINNPKKSVIDKTGEACDNHTAEKYDCMYCT